VQFWKFGARLARVKIRLAMSKAFVKEESDSTEEPAPAEASALPAGSKNYITPAGFARLKAELRELVEVERPEVVRTVSWAASNGDRSENGDYIYGKRRLREIDRRVRFLIKRLENAEVVHSSGRDTDQVFFGASVRVRMNNEIKDICIVGLDEVDPAQGKVSWVSPIARALLKARAGDTVTLRSPSGEEKLEIIDVRYP
jgi:transcription elongation factor GreB